MIDDGFLNPLEQITHGNRLGANGGSRNPNRCERGDSKSDSIGWWSSGAGGD
jgi:hypothetical protein